MLSKIKIFFLFLIAINNILISQNVPITKKIILNNRIFQYISIISLLIGSYSLHYYFFKKTEPNKIMQFKMTLQRLKTIYPFQNQFIENLLDVLSNKEFNDLISKNITGSFDYLFNQIQTTHIDEIFNCQNYNYHCESQYQTIKNSSIINEDIIVFLNEFFNNFYTPKELDLLIQHTLKDTIPSKKRNIFMYILLNNNQINLNTILFDLIKNFYIDYDNFILGYILTKNSQLINQKDTTGSTALHYAKMPWHINIIDQDTQFTTIELMIHFKANPFIKNNDNKTIFEILIDKYLTENTKKVDQTQKNNDYWHVLNGLSEITNSFYQLYGLPQYSILTNYTEESLLQKGLIQSFKEKRTIDEQYMTVFSDHYNLLCNIKKIYDEKKYNKKENRLYILYQKHLLILSYCAKIINIDSDYQQYKPLITLRSINNKDLVGEMFE